MSSVNKVPNVGPIIWDVTIESLNPKSSEWQLLSFSWNEEPKITADSLKNRKVLIKIPSDKDVSIKKAHQFIRKLENYVGGFILPLDSVFSQKHWLDFSFPQGLVLGAYRGDDGLTFSDYLNMGKPFKLFIDTDGYERILQYKRGDTGLAAYLHHLYTQRAMGFLPYSFLRFFEQEIPGEDLFWGVENRVNWFFFFCSLSGDILLRENGLYSTLPKEWKAQLDVIVKMKMECSHLAVTEVSRGVITLCHWNEKKKYSLIVNLEDRFGMVNIPTPIMGEDQFGGDSVLWQGVMKIPRWPKLIVENFEGKIR